MDALHEWRALRNLAAKSMTPLHKFFWWSALLLGVTVLWGCGSAPGVLPPWLAHRSMLTAPNPYVVHTNKPALHSPKHTEFLHSVRHVKPKLRLRLGALAPGSVSLAWSSSPGTNVAGYNIYVGIRTGTWTNKINMGTATAATVGGLVTGTNYNFVVTAYDQWGLESDYSNEVFARAGVAMPTLLKYPLYVDTATNIAGPFPQDTNILRWVTNSSPKQFFRLRIGPGQVP